MQLEALKLIEDIRDAAEFALEATGDLNLNDYLENRLVRQAVERNLQIIGEAANKLNKLAPDVAERIGDIARIVAFRNILVHGYDMLDHEIVWQVVQDELPTLVERSKELLSKGPGLDQ